MAEMTICDNCIHDNVCGLEGHLDEAMTFCADVQPVRRGRWIHFNDDGIIFCSECKHEAYWDTDYGQQLFDYCPYCGARMKQEG